jgi:hypothetical protein
MPLLVSGGQTFAHAPEQTDLLPVSATQRYSARPDAPVRYVPSLPLAVLIVRPDEPPELDAGAGFAGVWLALVLELALLPHAATTSDVATTATATPAGRNIAVVSFAIG